MRARVGLSVASLTQGVRASYADFPMKAHGVLISIRETRDAMSGNGGMNNLVDSPRACFSRDYPDFRALGPVVEDCVTRLGPGEMEANARSLLGPDTSITGLLMRPLCAGGAVILPDRVCYLVPVTWEGEYRIDSREIEAGSVYMVDSPNGFLSLGCNRYFYGITMNRDAFRAAAAALLGTGPEDVVTENALLELPVPLKKLLVARCARLLSQVPAEGEAYERICTEALLAEVQEILLEIYLLGRRVSGRVNAAYRNGPRIVRRAEAHFERCGNDPISLADLCAATGVSSSALYAAFADTVGMPPLRYFRMRRLNSVHHALERSVSERGLVTHVATSHGFSELGRFSVEYRQVFGTSPSATLARGSSTRASASSDMGRQSLS